MDSLLFVMVLVILICIFVILGKLNQIEFLLRNLQNSRPPQKPAEPPRIQDPAGNPPPARKPTASPAPAPAMTAAPRPVRPPVQPVFELVQPHAEPVDWLHRPASPR